MPSVFSHASAPVAIGGAAVAGPSRLPVWGLGALGAVVPDTGALAVFLPGHRLARAARRNDERRPRSGVLRSVLRHPLLPSMATDRGLADIDRRALQSAWPAGHVERARLGLVAGEPDLPGRSGHSAAPWQVGCRNAPWSRVMRGEEESP